jgi:hypothetical protein
MTFEEKHAERDEDPLNELRRRLQPWASAPDSRGESLDACIVPRQTVQDAITLLEMQREMMDLANRAMTRGNA